MKAAIPFKTEKSAEKVEVEDERHIQIIMELVRQVDEDRAFIKDNMF